MKEIIINIKRLPELFSKDGVSKEEINKAQTELCVTFSADYLEVLANFGILLVNGHEIIGLSGSPRMNVVAVTQEERLLNPDVNPDWYVIEQTNIDHIIIWQNQKGEIFQTQPELDNLKIAENLLEYIES